MTEITIRVIHEWRPGHADPLARFERMIEAMDDIATRLSTSVDNLAAALGNHVNAINEVATAIRNHPASTTDNGKLSTLADRLDSITSSLNSTTSELSQLASQENAGDAQPPADTTTQPPLGDSSGGDASAPPVGSNTAPPGEAAPPSGDTQPPIDTGTGIAGDGTLTHPVGGQPPADQSSQLPVEQTILDLGAGQQVAGSLLVSPMTISGIAGQPLAYTLAVSGGSAPYSFSSSLEDISVDASGNVSGTPANEETGTITVTDSGTAAQTASVGVVIVAQ